MATIFGTTGNDTINASFATPTTAGADTIYGLAGDDFIVRSLGNDTIDGGDGFDTLDYSASTNRVVVNVNLQQLRELAGFTVVKLDRINSIEEFRTGSGNDSLTGGGADELFRPGLGIDTIQGGLGSDTLSYADATARVFVDLARSFALDQGGSRDGIDGIESARSGTGNDVLRGGLDFGFLRGGAGHDTLISGWDGTSSFTQSIAVDYNERTSGSQVTVDLAAGIATIGAETDTLIGIFAQVRGGAGADTLLGNEYNNIFRPRGGADLIDGRAGFDRVDYRDEAGTDPDADGFVVTASLNAASGGSGVASDGTIDSYASVEWLRGSIFRDSLSGSGLGGVTFGAITISFDNQHTLEGWAGNDVLTGQAGNFVIARYTSDQGGIVVDLAAGSAIDQWGDVDTLVNIWGIQASAFDDVITLGTGDEWTRPGEGYDTVNGGAGLDRVSYSTSVAGIVVDLAAGTAKDGFGTEDTLLDIEAITGSVYGDTILGDGADNWFSGGAGDDTLDGRGGIDTAVYFYNPAGVVLNLAAGIATGAGTDTLLGIENAIGSAQIDTLVGGSGDNALYGHIGDDKLAGLAGNDLLDGGEGNDTADYAVAASRVVVNLTLAGAQNTLGAGLDTLVSIENVIATAFNDTITGNALVNTITSGAGADTVFGGDGDDEIDGGDGDDILQGNAGTDWVSYQSVAASVTVSLTAQGGYQVTVGAGLDYLAGFENLRGGTGADGLEGNAQANVLDGYLGNDVLNGGDGDDTLIAGLGDDTLFGGNGLDTVSYQDALAGVLVTLLLPGPQFTLGGGVDTLTGIEYLTGSTFNDTLFADNANNILKGLDGNDVLEGGLGTDVLNGGAGIDLASYAGATGPVTVYLNASSSTGAAGTDYFTDMEGFIGSAFNDTLVGNVLGNVLKGGAGDDRLSGLAGDDILTGNAGNDIYYGDLGSDTADYSDATLTVRAVLGSAGFVDTINYGLDKFDSIENLVGGSARDFLTGDANANVIDGRAGADVISAAAGNDTILTGSGDDDVTGGLGADRIVLGDGFDIIRFGALGDSTSAAMDVLLGFTQSGAGFDRIGLENNSGALVAGVTPIAIVLGARQVIEAASQLSDVLAQIGAMTASTASTLAVTQIDVNFGAAAGRYLVVNDTVAAFGAATDMLIQVQMDPASSGNLTAGNFFLF